MYDNLQFPKIPGRPFIYSDFVTTIDGKVFVKKDGYWPIGSKIDFETFTYLRAHADAIIDGKGTALQFGMNAIKTFNSENFKTMRKQIGKSKPLEYIVVTKDPNKQIQKLSVNPYKFTPTIFEKGIDELLEYLKEKQYKNVFINGGPTLLASFIEKKLIDELFVTIAPKIFGNEDGKTLTMVEGLLYSSDSIPTWNLVSVQSVENEVYLRYRRKGLSV